MLQILEAVEDNVTNLETQANKLAVVPEQSEHLVGMQEDREFKAILNWFKTSLGYVRCCLKTNKNKERPGGAEQMNKMGEM